MTYLGRFGAPGKGASGQLANAHIQGLIVLSSVRRTLGLHSHEHSRPLNRGYMNIVMAALQTQALSILRTGRRMLAPPRHLAASVCEVHSWSGETVYIGGYLAI